MLISHLLFDSWHLRGATFCLEKSFVLLLLDLSLKNEVGEGECRLGFCDKLFHVDLIECKFVGQR